MLKEHKKGLSMMSALFGEGWDFGGIFSLNHSGS